MTEKPLDASSPTGEVGKGDWQEYFEKNNEFFVESRWRHERRMVTEELYQAFKARLKSECTLNLWLEE